MSTEYGFVIVIVFIIIVVAVFRKFASTDTFDVSEDTFDKRAEYLKRYRSMDDDELEEVLARLLRDKLADGDSLSAIRHVMSERSLCNTPAEKDKSWQEPLVTENNKHHTQAKEEKSRVDQFTPLEDDVNRSKTDRDDSCNDHSTASGFFSFRKMVSRFLIQFIYVIGMIVITLSGLSYWKMALESNNERLAYTYFGLGLLILIGGNLVWRVISELLIVIFNIHNILASIEKKMG